MFYRALKSCRTVRFNRTFRSDQAVQFNQIDRFADSKNQLVDLLASPSKDIEKLNLIEKLGSIDQLCLIV